MTSQCTSLGSSSLSLLTFLSVDKIGHNISCFIWCFCWVVLFSLHMTGKQALGFVVLTDILLLPYLTHMQIAHQRALMTVIVLCLNYWGVYVCVCMFEQWSCVWLPMHPLSAFCPWLAVCVHMSGVTYKWCIGVNGQLPV